MLRVATTMSREWAMTAMWQSAFGIGLTIADPNPDWLRPVHIAENGLTCLRLEGGTRNASPAGPSRTGKPATVATGFDLRAERGAGAVILRACPEYQKNTATRQCIIR